MKTIIAKNSVVVPKYAALSATASSEQAVAKFQDDLAAFLKANAVLRVKLGRAYAENDMAVVSKVMSIFIDQR